MTRAINARRGQAQTQPSLAQIVTETVRMLVARDRVTWDEVSAGSGIPRSSFGKRLNGEIEWRAGEIQALAEYFEVSPALLVTGITIDPGVMSQIRCSMTDPVTSDDDDTFPSSPGQQEQPVIRPSWPRHLPRPCRRDPSHRPGDNRPAGRPLHAPLRPAAH